MAKNGDPLSFPVPHVMTHYRDCDFSFTGLKTYFKRLIHDEVTKQGNISTNYLDKHYRDLLIFKIFCNQQASSTKMFEPCYVID